LDYIESINPLADCSRRWAPGEIQMFIGRLMKYAWAAPKSDTPLLSSINQNTMHTKCERRIERGLDLWPKKPRGAGGQTEPRGPLLYGF